ncbi:hypothetical protein [Trinickia mobilis]|uniref:hypothetical protein n=1 Tax=Trinickia mobilis TaxID=2816356 RepID=UPI001A8DB9A6|nr:hypothetical protein [Trinickia mobilis]
MNTRHVQTFLMVSAAFFAMSAPVRATSGNTLAAAVAHTAQIAEAAADTKQVHMTLEEARF